MTPMRASRGWRAATISCVALVTIAACSTSPPAPTPTPLPTASQSPTATPTPTPTPTADPAEAAAEADALAAYSAYWAGIVNSYSDPTQPQDPAIEAHAGHTALTDAQSVLIKYRQDGVRMVGEPTFSPVATDVVLGAEPTVTVADCIDVADWQPIFTATGDSAGAPGQRTRVSYESTLVQLEGRWLVWEVTVDRDTPC